MEGLGFHFDKDEGLSSLGSIKYPEVIFPNILLFPLASTLCAVQVTF
jgi:hypothetical protein